MKDEVLGKIRAQASIGTWTEKEVIYLLVEVRKFLDHVDRKKKSFTSLRAHCDWALHIDLSASAGIIVRGLDENLLHHKRAWDADCIRRSEIFSLAKFREELGGLLAKNNAFNFCEDSLTWTPFLKEYVKVVSECPLVFKTDRSFENIQSATLRFLRLPLQPEGNGYDSFGYQWTVKLRNGSEIAFSKSTTFRIRDVAAGVHPRSR